MDVAGLPALVDAIRHLHGLEATWLESVQVTETFAGMTVWTGVVQVFEVNHPRTTKVYAWSHETQSGKRRFRAVLGVHPVDSPEQAVQAAIMEEFEKGQN
jgi:hypothetical protein